MSKSTATPDALDFEASKSVMLAKSEHRAWTITKGACALTGLSWIALALLMPLKTVEPYLVTVDKQSGQTQLLAALNETTFTQQEALDRYWIANYVSWREVYDWYTIQRDYDMTLAFSSPNVQAEYAAIYDGDNALDAEWGKRIKANIKILSIVSDVHTNIATVRFEKTIKATDDAGQGQTQRWVATLAYNYNLSPRSDAERLLNPIGFEVTSYRVDPELIQ
ncbi:channel protein VirB8 [Vibrio ichthyoenteri ATCC 700023]|uniref:Channel protein VirB8 n=1 Tax=Vibrio ichthyoenteri ATCC 700023 TaxID=870968 RepID=F9S7T9_9VIBR|nr:type IV secretion system protein [Vibrio ichthyoenteri]EGU30989.1 channel protein VirB8 [Vibrio ichthyoenteri ATCC 700023]